MSKRSLAPRWFMAMVAASAALVIYGTTQERLAPTPPSAPAPTSQIVPLHDQLWLDSIPENSWDSFQMYVFLKKGHKVGLHVQAHSTFKQTLEVFEYKDKAGGDLFFYFPHDQRKAQTKYSIIPLREPQGPFTCKLRLEQDPQNGGQPHIFYSGPELILKGVQEAPLPYSTRRQIGQWLESAVWPTQLQSAPQEG